MKYKDYLILLALLGAVTFAGVTLIPKLTPNEKSMPTSARVDITESGYVPETIVVEKGTVVTFHNNDTVSHKIVSNLSDLDNVGNIEAGTSFSFVFNKVGAWTFQDLDNVRLYKGKVIVN